MAFTVVELLIVIAILAVLAAILTPVLASAKLESMRASSTSDLRQTFAECTLYSNDWDGRVPYAVDECDWRGRCRSQLDTRLWQVIQQQQVPPFSVALKPYGFDRILFRVQTGRGPEYYQTNGTSYVYMLVLSSAPLQPLEENGCPYFITRGADFWNGGVYDTNLEAGERWLDLFFDGQVKHALYEETYTKADDCRQAYSK